MNKFIASALASLISIGHPEPALHGITITPRGYAKPPVPRSRRNRVKGAFGWSLCPCRNIPARF